MRDVTIHEGINPATGYISTHTSHAGRDGPGPPAGPGYRGFLLTRPMRDVTKDYETYIAALEISTHTSHAGRDFHRTLTSSPLDISTHTSHAGRDSTHSGALA